ncbi:hypothetical protein Q1695_003651 [Nippostrongylus brasiliensis]|nr:hypothetical protein Q1695_003651 [Nippostrongylus brasiliensis]
MARSFKLKKSRTAEKKPSKKEKKDKEKAKDKMKKKTKKKVAAIESLSGETVGSEEEDSSSSEEEKPAPETIKPVPLTLADRGPEKKVLPGATSLPAPILPSYTRRILMEERPDLFSNEEKTDMEETELDLLDKYVRDHAELKGDDLIVTDDKVNGTPCALKRANTEPAVTVEQGNGGGADAPLEAKIHAIE